MRQTFLPAVAAAALLAVPSYAGIASHITRTFNVSGAPRLVVDIDMGDVDVRAGAAGKVGVQVLRTVSTNDQAKAHELINKFTYDVQQNGNVVSVRIDNRSRVWFDWGIGPRLRMKAVVTVPRNAVVQLATSGGDVIVLDLDGVVQARTSGGDILLGRLGGQVKASTSGGDVTVKEMRSAVDVSTSGGDILVEGAPAGVTAKTSGGDITIRRAGGNIVARTSGGDIDLEGGTGVVEARTSGGDVVARFASAPRSDVNLSTSGGSVHLVVPVTSGFELDASSNGGDVSSSIPVLVQGKRHDDHLVGRVNGGGPRVRLRSSAGDIVIASR